MTTFKQTVLVPRRAWWGKGWGEGEEKTGERAKSMDSCQIVLTQHAFAGATFANSPAYLSFMHLLQLVLMLRYGCSVVGSSQACYLLLCSCNGVSLLQHVQLLLCMFNAFQPPHLILQVTSDSAAHKVLCVRLNTRHSLRRGRSCCACSMSSCRIISSCNSHLIQLLTRCCVWG